MPSKTLVSIIIPCKDVDGYTRECIEYCRSLDYPNFEIILLPDYSTEAIDGVIIIATGPVPPGVKRNIGVKNSSGEFCAFIDNDAYPRSDWLTSALKYFEDPEVGGVGGPGLTPEADGFMQKAGGYVLSSFMVGNLSSRYKTKSCFESAPWQAGHKGHDHRPAPVVRFPEGLHPRARRHQNGHGQGHQRQKGVPVG